MDDVKCSGQQTKPQAERYRTLVEESNDIATVIDTDGTITFVSSAVEDVLGYEPDELVGTHRYERIHPEDREQNAEAIEAVQTTPAEPHGVEVRFKRADGTWCWIDATMSNQLDNKAIDGILISGRDITERKERERESRDLAREYEALLHSVEDAIFFLTVDRSDEEIAFRFDRLSPAYERQTGLTTEGVRGRTPQDVFGQDVGTELEANYHRCVNIGEPISYQEELRVSNEARIWQTKLAPVVTDGEISRLVGITRNVTDRVERERQLRRQNDRLDEFASVISHDLRNPLNVAQARATLLDEEAASEHLNPLVQALDRMEAIVSDTLTLARQGETIGDAESVCLTDIVGKCWATVDTDDASIQIVDEVQFQGDPNRLQQVFENLFRNAIEHGGESVTIHVGCADGRTLYVEDDGQGIPAAERDTIFEPGHSLASDGTGFGLAIVKRIAEAHGWTVAATEGTNGGARFEFEMGE